MISLLILFMELTFLGVLNALSISASVGLYTLLIIAFSIAYFVDLERNKQLEVVKEPLMGGYLLRVALLYFDIYGRRIYILPNSGSDAGMFYREALNVLYGGKSNRGLFVYVLGYLYKYIGPSRLYSQFLLALCSLVAIHVGEVILRECDVTEEIRFRIMMILCFLPNFAILSSVFLRESIVTMFITFSLYCYTAWLKDCGFKWFLLAIINVLLGMSFHSGAVGVLVGYFLGLILYDRYNKSLTIKVTNVLIASFFILLSVYLLNNYSDIFLGKFLRVDTIDDIANVRDVAGSSYARYVGNSNSVRNIIVYTIPRIAFFLLSPMPFQWRGVSDIIAFIFSSLFYLLVVFKTIRYYIDKRDNNRVIITLVAIVAIVTAIVFAWGVSNSGTAVRHRDKMVVLYGVLLGLVSEPENNNEIVAHSLLHSR